MKVIDGIAPAETKALWRNVMLAEARSSTGRRAGGSGSITAAAAEGRLWIDGVKLAQRPFPSDNNNRLLP